MAVITIRGSNVGNALTELLMSQDIQPGDAPSYQICKNIYTLHPLGAKMAEAPITMAQCQQREITVPGAPEDKVKEAFINEWKSIGADEHIHNAMKTSRIYGIASIALLAEGVPPDRPIDYKRLHDLKITFNVLDPLNTAGSLVLNQNPNALDYQKHFSISVNGKPYHRSRAVVVLNEKPIYIDYTQSAFGYVGRSVYQRALFPLKSFVQSMVTDDLVARKAGIVIAKLKPAGSIVDSMMQLFTGWKRNVIKEAETDNVISINTPDEDVYAIDLTNVEAGMGAARKNIIENIASSADMPAKLLLQETFAEGFGEGTEDAKYIARFIDRIRVSMDPLYGFFDTIVQYRAWNPEFYKTIQAQFPEEYGKKGYTQAFYEWTNAFKATWPSLLTEPDSEKVKTDDVKLRGIVSVMEAILPIADPMNKAVVLTWAADNINANKFMFSSPLTLDVDELTAFLEKQAKEQDEAKKAAADAAKNEGKEPKPEGLTRKDSIHLIAAE